MSIVYCEYCDEYIDTDFNAEHFNTGMEARCEQELEDTLTEAERQIQELNQ